MEARCLQDIPGVTVSAETHFLTTREHGNAVAQEVKPASAILLQAEKKWESHQLEAWKALSSESPVWEGQHGPNRAAGVILQQHKALRHLGRQAQRDPLLPSSLGVQTDWHCHHLQRKGKCTLGFWLI